MTTDNERGIEIYDVCPACLSKFKKIRGFVYPSGQPAYRCTHSWHGQYMYDELDLTVEDEKLLKGMLIGE